MSGVVVMDGDCTLPLEDGMSGYSGHSIGG